KAGMGQSPPQVRATFTSTSAGIGSTSGALASTFAACSQAATASAWAAAASPTPSSCTAPTREAPGGPAPRPPRSPPAPRRPGPRPGGVRPVVARCLVVQQPTAPRQGARLGGLLRPDATVPRRQPRVASKEGIPVATGLVLGQVQPVLRLGVLPETPHAHAV